MKKIISKNELKNQKKLKSGNLILFFALCGISLGFLGCKETSLVLVEGTTIDGLVENSEVFIEGRRVVISDFYISNHEVTQEEYTSVMGRNPSYFSRNPPVNEEQQNRPVECVNWYDAIVYCNKRSLAEGLIPCYSLNGSKNPSDWGIIPSIFSQEWNEITWDTSANGYRLPTEVEWEYATRGGKKYIGEGIQQYKYSGSDTIDFVAWYNENSGEKTHEVKEKDSNQLDLYDMSGNVSEWCWDWFTEITPETETVVTKSDTSGTSRVTRDGNWGQPAFSSTVYSRSNDNPSLRSYGLGFRVVRSSLK